jgi:hypothetical protein
MARKRSGRYGKVYADLLSDPKLTDLMLHRAEGKQAMGVHALALAWCALHLTAGNIPRSTLSVLYGCPRDAAALVAARLWEVTPDGWFISGYTEANLTKIDVQQRSLQGSIDICKRYMADGKRCSCGHHSQMGDLIGDPIGDLVGHL